ncbi:MAG: lysostaphin resistance A-like protein [Bacteroidia bacterium]
MSRAKALAYFFLALGVASIVYFIAASVAAQMGIYVDLDNPRRSLVALAFPLVVGMGGIGYLFWQKLSSPSRYAFYKPVPMGVWLWIPVWVVSIQPFMAALSLDPERFSLPDSWRELEMSLEAVEAQTDKLLRSLSAAVPVEALLATALVPGITEEILFRGALLGYMRQVVSPTAAVWVVGILFSLYHFQPYGLVPRAILGISFGYFALAHKSLLPAMYAHALNNALMVTVAALSESSFPALKKYLETDYHPPILVALISGIVAFWIGKHIYKQLCSSSES